MRLINKKVKTGILLTGITLGGIGFGAYTQAEGNLFGKIINGVNAEIGKAGYDKKEELIGDVEGSVQGAVEGKLEPKVEGSKDAVVSELQQYFDQKVDGITETDGYKNTEKQIKVIEDDVTKRYKKEIDQAFNGL